jgi:hypothetical protein
MVAKIRAWELSRVPQPRRVAASSAAPAPSHGFPVVDAASETRDSDADPVPLELLLAAEDDDVLALGYDRGKGSEARGEASEQSDEDEESTSEDVEKEQLEAADVDFSSCDDDLLH